MTSTTLERPGGPAQRTGTPIPVVTCDAHVGPRVRDDLRQYCPAAHLEAYDEYLTRREAMGKFVFGDFSAFGDASGEKPEPNRTVRGTIRNQRSTGHYESATRLHDLDRDGIACEVIFHDTQNGEPMPFTMFGFNDDPAQAAAGIRMYNQWLADFVANEPDRRVGLAQLPIWDLDATLEEVTWAREHGLQGVNFPSMRLSLPAYDAPHWEPFWALCSDLDMPLTTHAGAGVDVHSSASPLASITPSPNMILAMTYESSGWPTRRGMPRMVFGGVFERYPNLRLVITEAASCSWWEYTMVELDSIYDMSVRVMGTEYLPRRPSEYCATNVFCGASGMAPFETAAAVKGGYAANMMWGSDYPHVEGTWQHDEDESLYPTTKLQLRYAFADVPIDATRQMIGGTAAAVYGVDLPKLQGIAERIGAITDDEIRTTLPHLPPDEDRGVHCWRTFGPFS